VIARDPKGYWKSLEERERDEHSIHARAVEPLHPLNGLAVPLDRRDFLRAAGFTIAGTALASCSRAPAEKAIPFLIQPEGLVPGRSSFYTSTCAGCSAGCGVLVKVHDGRPIKLEGNPRHPLSRGGLCAVGQASPLGLYDSLRFSKPLKAGMSSSWTDVDEGIAAELEVIRNKGGAVRVLTGTVNSPTLLVAIDAFLKTLPDGRRVAYDALSSSALLDAHELTHGIRALPRVRFDRAEVIVAFDADFLGTWLSPVQFSEDYRDGRSLDATPRRFSYHAQLESRMSLTGTRADRRVRVAPGEIGPYMTALAARVARLGGSLGVADAPDLPPGAPPILDDLAERLWQARGKSVVVCGIQDVPTQLLCNHINEMLGAYGTTLDLERPSRQAEGSDRDLEALLAELEQGTVAALFIHGVNPAYDLPRAQPLIQALGRVPLLVSLAERPDETAALARYVAPLSHALESWGDAEPAAGTFSILQPALQRLGETRPAAESFSVWSGAAKQSYDLVREHWEAAIFPRQKTASEFQDFWEQALRDGFVQIEAEPLKSKGFNLEAVRAVGALFPPADSFTLVLYPKVALLDGRHAYNAWLQELPDPVSKIAWDNYACLSVTAARRLGVRDGDVVRLDTQDGPSASLELPVYIQPGQHDGVVAVARGYGSALSSRFTTIAPKWIGAQPSVGNDGRVGANAAPFLDLAGGVLATSRRHVRITKTGKLHELASTQDHFSVKAPEHPRQAAELPPVIRETTLASLGRPPTAASDHKETGGDLYPADHVYPGHKWAMVVDLATCTGCSACVVACQAENNVPVVGKDEVRRKREMHWIRLDRYYSGEDDAVDVAVQPMLCQHCDNAPCETVCPVNASVHNSEGLNLQVYNRCVGTRFCENNCPYKVRRFNWFEYARDDRVQNLALNPDVTVRSRGVMEKCTFCVQRIQEAELRAKHEGATMADGALQTACQQSCPSRAIVFGDSNDPNGRVAQLQKSERSFRVLEELNVRPAVTYLAVVRNREGG
jgi:molybdopterin-containing oxidoreductase family iron-sulfur binding subunit